MSSPSEKVCDCQFAGAAEEEYEDSASSTRRMGRRPTLRCKSSMQHLTSRIIAVERCPRAFRFTAAATDDFADRLVRGATTCTRLQSKRRKARSPACRGGRGPDSARMGCCRGSDC